MSQETWDLLQGVLRTVLMLAFVSMGVLHFLPGAQRTMAAIIPPRLRFGGLFRPINLVVFTGLCEVFGGLGLLLPSTRLAAGIALTVFLLAVFPANVYAARNPERFGRLAIPFWPRLIAQLVLIALVLLSVL